MELKNVSKMDYFVWNATGIIFFLFKSYRYNNYANKNLNLNYIVIVKCDLHGQFAKICN